MKVLPVQAEKQSFKAKLISTHDYNNYFNAINNCKGLPYIDCHNGLRRLRAIENFPTNAEVKLYTTKTDGCPWSLYGVIESQFAKYIDTEPVTDNNSMKAVSNILKRIFLQENTDKLAKLIGVEDVSVLEKWRNAFFIFFPLMKENTSANKSDMENSYSNWFNLQDGSV